MATDPLLIAHDALAEKALTTQLAKYGRSDVTITTEMRDTVS